MLLAGLLALTACRSAAREPADSLPAASRLEKKPAHPDVIAAVGTGTMFALAGDTRIRLGAYQPEEHEPVVHGEDDKPMCCGYDEENVVLVDSSGQTAQAIAGPYGSWVALHTSGNRIWALDQTSVIEAGSGPFVVVYSPDRGARWF